MDAVTGLEFAPLLPVPALWAFGALMMVLFAIGIIRGAKGAFLRLLAAMMLMLALAGPKLVKELRDPLSDVALVLLDRSESNGIDGRGERLDAAETRLRQDAQRLTDETLEVRFVDLDPAPDGVSGTKLFAALETALADISPDRLAGVIAVTDGRAHDAPEDPPALAAPLHHLSTGRDGEFDRRLVLERAPSFGIVGEDIRLRVRVEDLGEIPASAPPVASVEIRVNGQPIRQDRVAVGESRTLIARIDHGGANVFEVIVAPISGELTERNNRAVFTLNGARDRLRVLLVSGEPHAGERAWRNLLKADPSVDLVHFTILRPPEKSSGAAISELALIPFPTRELFMDRIDEFDLVIFDRYTRRGVLAPAYIQNIANYVYNGGAVFIAAGDAFAGSRSIYRSPLAEIIPAEPSGEVFEFPYRPRATQAGERHPVTAQLWRDSLNAEGEPDWGRWLRQIRVFPTEGDVLMTGVEDEPLLVLDRVGQGRVALLGSDTIWLWSRGFEGGGPQAELLRRVAHWLMKEPELEEEALTARMAGDTITVERRSLAEEPEDGFAISPSGARIDLTFEEIEPGLWRATFEATELGLYEIRQGDRIAAAAIGPTAPKEFENPLATPEIFAPLQDVAGGGLVSLIEAGAPELRRIREGAEASGDGWVGLARREAYAVRGVTQTALAPGWLMLLLSAGLLLWAWRVEGR